MEDQRAALMREQTDLAEKYGFTYSEALSGAAAQAGHSAEEIQALTDKHGELEAQITSLDGQMTDAQKYVTQYGKAVEDSEAALSEAESATGSYTEAMEALVPPMKDVASASAEMTDRNKEVWASIEEISQQAEALADAYEKAYSSALSSVQGQYDLWDKAAEVSATSAGDINAALESQVSYWQGYNANLESLRERAGDVQGLSDVIASFADGSSESVNAVAGMANATDEELAAMVENWKALQKEHDTTSDSIAEFVTDFTAQMDELGLELQADIEAMDYSAESGEAARATLQSFVSVAEDWLPRVQEAYGRVGSAAGNALTTAMRNAMPSGLRAVTELNGYATGTTNAEPGFAMVGENGPELVFFQGGEQVVNATQTAALQRQSALSATPAASGGGGQVVINLSPVYNLSGGMSGADVRDELSRHNESLREIILEVVEDARIDSARRKG